MAKISSYPSDANVTTSDRLIGSDNENSNETKNFGVGDIINLTASIILPPGGVVPYTGATANVDLGAYGITTSYLTSTLGMFIDGAISLNGDEGNIGEVLISQGPGATPSWSNALSQFVPYTGATGNVDLGTYNLIADNVQANIFQLNSGGILGLYGTLQLNGSPGAAGQVLTSSGGGVPTWTSLPNFSTFVPYTGATTNVDLGGYGLTTSYLTSTLGIRTDGAISLNGDEGGIGEVLISTGAGSVPVWTDVNGLITSNLYKGSFYDTITQTLTGGANVAVPVILRDTDALSTNGISIVTDGTNLSRITFANAGTYNILFSAQLANSGGTSQTVDFWLRQNGSTAAANIPNTNGKVLLQGNANYLMAAWNYFITVAAGDYIQLMWTATSTNITMVADAATAVHPATPSIILTANIV